MRNRWHLGDKQLIEYARKMSYLGYPVKGLWKQRNEGNLPLQNQSWPNPLVWKLSLFNNPHCFAIFLQQSYLYYLHFENYFPDSAYWSDIRCDVVLLFLFCVLLSRRILPPMRSSNAAVREIEVHGYTSPSVHGNHRMPFFLWNCRVATELFHCIIAWRLEVISWNFEASIWSTPHSYLLSYYTRISYLELPQRTWGSSCSIIQFAPGIVACDEGRRKVLLLWWQRHRRFHCFILSPGKTGNLDYFSCEVSIRANTFATITSVNDCRLGWIMINSIACRRERYRHEKSESFSQVRCIFKFDFRD